MTTMTTGRPLSVAELQAALNAAWRGEFTDPYAGQAHWGRGQAPGSGNLGASATGGRRAGDFVETGGRPATTTVPAGGSCLGVEPVAAVCSLTAVGPVVVVLAAHAGAGASTVAVMLGDAATATGARTRLIECADPGRSGVAGATDTELGEDRCGWRRGRRGLLELDRPATAAGRLADVAQPRPVTPAATGESLTVIDAGWPAFDVLAASSWVTGLLETARLLLVCRVTVPGIRQTELLLAALSGRDPVIAALGPAKWPGAVTASCGPLLRAARDTDRVVPVPIDRHLQVTGLTAGPLPKQLLPAGRALAGRVLEDFPVLSRAG